MVDATTRKTNPAPYLGTPWWAVLIEGIAAIIISALLFASPGLTMAVLIQVLGWYWLITGIIGLVVMFLDTTVWGLKLFGGILGVFAGILVIQHPLWATVIVPTVFVFILGIDGVLIGGVDLVKALQGAGWGVGILGIMSVLIGLYLVLNPLAAAIALPWALAFLAFVGGIVATVMAFQMKKAALSPVREIKRAA